MAQSAMLSASLPVKAWFLEAHLEQISLYTLTNRQSSDLRDPRTQGSWMGRGELW